MSSSGTTATSAKQQPPSSSSTAAGVAAAATAAGTMVFANAGAVGGSNASNDDNPFLSNLYEQVTPEAFEKNVRLVITYDKKGTPFYRYTLPVGAPGYYMSKGGSKKDTPDFAIRFVDTVSSFLDIEGFGSIGEDEQRDFAAAQNTPLPLDKFKHSAEVHFLYFPDDVRAVLEANGAFDEIVKLQRCNANTLLLIDYLTRLKEVTAHYEMRQAAAEARERKQPFQEVIVLTKGDMFLDQGQMKAELEATKAQREPTTADMLHYAALANFAAQEYYIVRTQNKDNMKQRGKRSEHRDRYPLPTQQQLIAAVTQLSRLYREGDPSWKTFDHDPTHDMVWTPSSRDGVAKFALMLRATRPAFLKPSEDAKAKTKDMPVSNVHAWVADGYKLRAYVDAEAKAFGYRPWRVSIATLKRNEDKNDRSKKMMYLDHDRHEAEHAAAVAAARTAGIEPPHPQRMVPYGSSVSICVAFQLTGKGTIRRSLVGAVVLGIKGKGSHRQVEFDVTDSAVARFIFMDDDDDATDAGTGAGTGAGAGVKRGAPDDTTGIDGDVAGGDGGGKLMRTESTAAPGATASTAGAQA
jgi:hypothetical protein